MPGPISNPLSDAPNALIRDRTARLVTTAHDITQALLAAGRGSDRGMQVRADVEAAWADVDAATETLTAAWQRVADTRRRLDGHSTNTDQSARPRWVIHRESHRGLRRQWRREARGHRCRCGCRGNGPG